MLTHFRILICYTNFFQLKLPIFKQFHKFIIGKGGATVKQIRQETNAKIDLPASGSDSDIIILTGKKEDVLKAQKKIQTIQSEQADVVSVRLVLINSKYMFDKMMICNRYVECTPQWIKFSSFAWTLSSSRCISLIFLFPYQFGLSHVHDR